MADKGPVLSQENLTMTFLEVKSINLSTDADAGASEGLLGQGMIPDALSGASVL